MHSVYNPTGNMYMYMYMYMYTSYNSTRYLYKK